MADFILIDMELNPLKRNVVNPFFRVKALE